MQKKYLHILIIAVVCLATYWTVFSHEVCLDDPYIFTQLPGTDKGLAGVFSVFNHLYGHTDYRPVVVFSYALEQWIFGGIHLPVTHGINLLLFILVCFLIYAVILLLPVKEKNTLALFVALLFVTHPIHSSVVSSIKNRDNLLSMLLGLLSWYFCLRSVLHRRLIHAILSVLFLTVALFAKLDSISFLFIIPLSVFIFYRDQWKSAAPAAALLIVAFVIRAVASVYFAPYPNSVIFTENPVVVNWDLTHRLAQSVQTLFFYIKFMIIPKGYWFYFGYDMLPLPELFSIKTALFVLINALFLTIAFWFWNKEKLVSFGILFFYATLLYCANFFVPVAGIIADRYAFIPSLGFCMAIAGIINYFCRRYIPAQTKTIQQKNKKQAIQKTGPVVYQKYIPLVLVGMICLVNMGFTMSRNKDWKNTGTLLAADMPHLTNSFEANRIAASDCFKKGLEIADSPEAKLDYIRQGLQYALQAEKIYDGNQYINESIGQAYFNTGHPDLASAQFQKTLQKFDTSRISMEVLGDIFFINTKYDSAQHYYNMAIKTFPAYEPVYFKYMRSLLKKNDLQAARSFTTDLLNKKPDWYLSYQCASFLAMTQKDSLNGLRLYKTSFDKGYRNTAYAAEVRNKLLRFGDTANARAMEQYMIE